MATGSAAAGRSIFRRRSSRFIFSLSGGRSGKFVCSLHGAAAYLRLRFAAKQQLKGR